MIKKLRQGPAYSLILWGFVLAIVFLPWFFAEKPVAFGVISFLFIVIAISAFTLPASLLYKFKKTPQDRLEDKFVLEAGLRKACFFIAGLFFISGFVKLQDITGFSYKLDEYWEVFGTTFMKPTSLFMAWFVSVLEIALGFALITGYRMNITTWLVAGMMIFFTFLTGYSAITGAVTDCGCFGDALKLTPTESFLKDVFLTLAVFPLWLLRGEIKPMYKGKLPMGLTLGSFVVFGLISYYTFQHLPCLDFRTAYKVCQDLNYNWQNFNEEDEIIAHDFVPFGLDCDLNEFQGATLMVISYDLETASEEGLKKAVELANQLKGTDIKVIGSTASLSDTKNKYIADYQIPFCMAGRDQTVLKTMIRSNPGLMAMQDGIIKAKWHHNDTPTVEELKAALGKGCK
ncbi:MAG: DoxX family membrane protein [Bacteroidia bacterium]|nr:DoxX family membrane protein [Bacteroidia bacterium]